MFLSSFPSSPSINPSSLPTITQLPAMAPAISIPLLFILILLTITFNSTLSDPRAKESLIICSNQTAPLSNRQQFVSNFIAALDSLTPQITSRRYGSTTNGSGNLTVNAFSQCFSDLSSTDCDLCFAQIKTQIQQCLPYQKLTRGGRLFFDGCYLRYDSSSFLSEFLSDQDRTVCGSVGFSGNSTVFKETARELSTNLKSAAVNSSGLFSVGSLTKTNVTLYGLAQCWEYLNASACSSCLESAVSSIGSCSSKIEARVMNAGCYLRYSTQKFYNNTVNLPSPSQGGNHLALILATVLPGLAFLMLVVGACFCGKRLVDKYREKNQIGKLLSKMNKSKLHFAYEVLEEATNYFDDSNKLGQGGSGSVYKGKLPNGTTVAIKRLFFNTRQWVDHFFNEINLISSIQHENLVKLLGCSITGPESLLVYEFLPNQSLQDHLFGKKNTKPLSWENRCKIILGTAKGLSYLHEESGYRIIHRDIKLGNVLLDNDFKAKIADFGLVRLLPEDKSHLTTAVAGTLGYMAPEYIVCGILTEKADVYSFGVLMIELISGKRNNSITEDSVCMLHTIWDLYVKRRLNEAIDKALEGKFKQEEAYRLLQIGLLCVQANAELRPSMSLTVKMVSDNDELPEPTQPPFLNSSSAEMSIRTHREASDSQMNSHRSSSIDSVGDNTWMRAR